MPNNLFYRTSALDAECGRLGDGGNLFADLFDFLTNKNGAFDKSNEKHAVKMMNLTMREIEKNANKTFDNRTEWEKKVAYAFS
ncbi:MAG: hypothetical protein FWF51_06575 [Chitinivibrionia bacterium]|nr:hypothetical protein [Chitinivibrionia bacterium]